MATFELNKGGRFSLDKGIQRVTVGLGWDAGDNVDLDASAFGLAHLQGGKPVFYNDGSHAVCYANKELRQPNGQFKTSDGSIIHSGDNRTGDGDGDDEVINFDFTKLPGDIVEIAIWITIYEGEKPKPNEAPKPKQVFGQVKNSYIRITNADTKGELCVYHLREEFAQSTAVQVGSFTKENGIWHFDAVGAGAEVELGKILEQYS
jgi:tellurium resistance protein TerD